MNIMLKKYRKVEFVDAEQFDGSEEMIKRYKLVGYGPDAYRFSWDYSFTAIVKGDFIITDEDGFHDVVSEDVFREDYEEWD